MRWSAWAIFVAGIGLLLAPFITGYYPLSTVATAEAVIVGLAIAGLALWPALRTNAPEYVNYILAVFGAWSVLAPYVLGYSTVEWARNSDIVAGVFVAAVAIARAVYSSPVLTHKKAAA